MNKALHAGFAALAVLCAAQSRAAPLDIEGRWVIDLPPMVAQAKAMKGGAKEIANLERTFKGGVMVIDAKTVSLSLAGGEGEPLSYPYKIAAADPNKPQCVNLLMAALPKPLAYCVNDGVLSVNDPTSALVSTYRRAGPDQAKDAAKAEAKAQAKAEADTDTAAKPEAGA
ncbi:hypothetical protein F2P45_02930 [Massilia sp. CCM 8733]|uniref:Uncharacterized protein n=1 Tax=Massilia mucilaginosa TaxID=2609282 RepID=A0ABX0NMF0_9BURK|nr:hypothetical protein [Massilia mucilaginosa]NHZ87990.1 hypothetical protein [Massilia mucilaginosa]